MSASDWRWQSFWWFEVAEHSGCYWMGKDEKGQPKIYFDDPERAAEAPKRLEAAPDAKKPDADVPEAEEPDPKEAQIWQSKSAQ